MLEDRCQLNKRGDIGFQLYLTLLFEVRKVTMITKKEERKVTFSWPGSLLHLTFRDLSLDVRDPSMLKEGGEPASITGSVLFSWGRKGLSEFVDLVLH